MQESSWAKAKRDSREWLVSHIIPWILTYILSGGGTVLITLLLPPDINGWMLTLYGFVGGFCGLCLLGIGTLVCNIFRAPYKQRNEARIRVLELEKQLEQPKQFEIVCPTTSYGLPINKLPEGRYNASVVGVSPAPIRIIPTSELTTINRLTISPKVILSKEGKGWETTT